MPPSSGDGYSTWQKKFTTCVSSKDNLPVGQAFKTLCATGCDSAELYQILWDYSRLKTDREKHKQKSRDAQRWIRRYRDLARLLQRVTTEFDDLRRLEQDEFFPGFLIALWGRDFQERVNLSAALMKFTAWQWARWSTPRKLASNDFILAYLCAYVKCATGRPQHKQIAFLLDAAWIAHGRLMDWNADMLQSKLRRIPGSMKKLAADVAFTNTKNRRQNHPKR
jgi:hypothetical protein